MTEAVPGDTSSESNTNDSMKQDIDLIKKDSEGVVTCAPEPTQPNNESGAPAKAHLPKRFRLLKWDEMVRLGDFVSNEDQRLEPWEGPSGFQADSFVKPIYRRDKSRRPQPKNRNE